MLDNKGKLFGRVSIVDLTVVMIIILAILGFGFNYAISKGGKTSGGLNSLLYNDKKTMPITVEIRVDGVREMTVKSVSAGEEVYETSKGGYLGKIAKVESSVFEDFIGMTDGTFKRVPVPDKFKLNLFINVDGLERDGDYFTADNQPLVVGTTLLIRSLRVSTSGTIVGITK